MKGPVQHLLMEMWVSEREGEGRDLSHHGQPSPAGEEVRESSAEAEREGFVVRRSGECRLTEKGEAVARALVRRHRLAERLLSDILELPEEEVEVSACRFEHYLSEGTAERICTLLGHPTNCPHGRMIPPGDCCRAGLRTIEPIVERLADLDPGEVARIVSLAPASGSRLNKLSALGLAPGSIVRLKQKLPSLVVQAGQTEVALDGALGSQIFVTRQTTSLGGGPKKRGWGLGKLAPGFFSGIGR